jgi:hypothetical protein
MFRHKTPSSGLNTSNIKFTIVFSTNIAICNCIAIFVLKTIVNLILLVLRPDDGVLCRNMSPLG